MCAGLLACLALFAPAPAFAADAAQALTARAQALALDDACAVFPAGVRTALIGGRLQAYGMLRRAGVSKAELAAHEAQSTGANAPTCDSEHADALVTHALDAYAAWKYVGAATFHAGESAWEAERVHAGTQLGWHVRQRAGADVALGLVKGLVDDEPTLALAVRGGAARATAARLRLRDTTLSDEPIQRLAVSLGLSSERRDRRVPPPSLSIVHWASARASGPEVARFFRTDERLGGDPEGSLFAFAPVTLDAFAALEPNEAVVAEIAFADGTSRDVVFDVGDFTAAALFALAER